MSSNPHASTIVADSQPHYTRTSVGLHWLIAALIVVALVVGWTMTDMPVSPQKLRIYNWHKWVGITVLWLAALRILWRVTHRPPEMVTMPAWQRIAAHALHGVLYLLMLAQPISGWIYSNAAGYPIVYLRLIPLPNLVAKNPQLAESWQEVHETLGLVLAIVVALHLLAALKHHLIDKDDTMRRMLRWLP